MLDHFMNRVVLKNNAVPTIFDDFPSYLQHSKEPRSAPKGRREANTTNGKHEYLFLPPELSLCAENIVYYISGVVARKLMSKLKCTKCVDALYELEPDRHRMTLVRIRDFLYIPSNDVFIICKMCVTHFRSNITGNYSVNKSIWYVN